MGPIQVGDKIKPAKGYASTSTTWSERGKQNFIYCHEINVERNHIRISTQPYGKHVNTRNSQPHKWIKYKQEPRYFE